MVVKINGKDETVNGPINLNKFVSEMALVPAHIVVEHNFRIAPEEEWADIVLKENDNVEIVSFVGGG